MTMPDGRVGVLLINFGEPERPTLEAVESYLERIFLQNVDLEGHAAEAAVARARQLAATRGPGLLEEYASIGGSPLNGQADAQAVALGQEMASRGSEVRVYSSFQFTEPSIAVKLQEARDDAVDVLVALPVYPMCGQSTTIAALDEVAARLDAMDWSPRLVSIAGWHWHPRYEELRARHTREFLADRGLDLRDPDTMLYFSVHGTPVKYLRSGNRYDRYVEEHCRAIASRLGADRYAIGFQNHTNRKVEWTQPDNEDRIAEIGERELVVVPIAFMHEQSETLAELDHELREFVEDMDKGFHRVPVPHDDPGFPGVLADLVTEAVEGAGMSQCRCRPDCPTLCTNGDRELPESPFILAAG
jgi:ferrochelatase